uniref:Luciferase 5 n=1 Tax=Odontosyllis octodentata TaxID=2336528 RepID=A0A5A4PY29_9ANNE|nr:luciferase 5 [Odontosyllis octodentata]
MKLLMFVSILCCTISLSLGLKVGVNVGVKSSVKATQRQCRRLVPSWSEIDCTPYKTRVYADLDAVWDGNSMKVTAEWQRQNYPTPSFSDRDKLLQYCLYRECRVNQAMVDYMNIHGYPHYCMTKTPEAWLNDQYWTRCKLRLNKTGEMTAQEYSAHFCFKVYHQTEPDVHCPILTQILSPYHPTVQQVQKSKEVFTNDAEPESEQWWVAVMRDINKHSVDENNIPIFHYGWIINMDENDYKNMVPLWSPYQGPTVPTRRDFPRIANAVKNNQGYITLGDYRNFNCLVGTYGSLRCEEFGVLSFNPKETIVLIPTLNYVLMAMTQHQDKVHRLEYAVWREAEAIKYHEYSKSSAKSHFGASLGFSIGRE